MSDLNADIVVVGAGNAALCAALAARETGAHVVVLESAPQPESGGNTRFTAGAMRVVYNGVDDLSAWRPIRRRFGPALSGKSVRATCKAPSAPGTAAVRIG